MVTFFASMLGKFAGSGKGLSPANCLYTPHPYFQIKQISSACEVLLPPLVDSQNTRTMMCFFLTAILNLIRNVFSINTTFWLLQTLGGVVFRDGSVFFSVSSSLQSSFAFNLAISDNLQKDKNNITAEY